MKIRKKDPDCRGYYLTIDLTVGVVDHNNISENSNSQNSGQAAGSRSGLDWSAAAAAAAEQTNKIGKCSQWLAGRLADCQAQQWGGSEKQTNYWRRAKQTRRGSSARAPLPTAAQAAVGKRGDGGPPRVWVDG